MPIDGWALSLGWQDMAVVDGKPICTVDDPLKDEQMLIIPLGISATNGLFTTFGD